MAGLFDKGGGGPQTTTQTTELPPEVAALLGLLADETSALAGQSKFIDLVPDLSSQTLAGISALENQFTNNIGVDFINNALSGGSAQNPFTGAAPSASLTNQSIGGLNQFAGLSPTVTPVTTSLNPLTGLSSNVGTNSLIGSTNSQTGALALPQNNQFIDEVTAAVTQAATQGVGDRFSQAGRGGSGGEALGLGTAITNSLSPFLFSAAEGQADRELTAALDQANRAFTGEESQLARDFGAGESFLDRSLASQESQLARDFGAQESFLDRLLTGDLATADQQFNADLFSISNLIGAQDALDSRGFAAGESQLDRLFAADESALGRGFSAFETDADRTQALLPLLFGTQAQEISNLLSAGSILEGNAAEQALEPFTRLQLLAGPIGTVLSGAPGTTTTTQPVNSNSAGNAIGTILTLAGLFL